MSDQEEINKIIMEKYFEDGRCFTGQELNGWFEEAKEILVQRKAAEGKKCKKKLFCF
jgi:hypothetical protein